MKKHVVLDFDGVIADTFNFHLQRTNQIYGTNVSPEEFRSFLSGNFYHNQHPVLSTVDWSDYARQVGHDQASTNPFPRAIESIKDLAKTYQLHLVTSGWESQVFPFLEKYQIKDLFSEFLCADKGTSKHEKLERLVEGSASEYIFVTDTVGDVHESNAVGIPVVAVTYGYHDKTTLSEGDPTYYSDSWVSTVEIIGEHFA